MMLLGGFTSETSGFLTFFFLTRHLTYATLASSTGENYSLLEIRESISVKLITEKVSLKIKRSSFHESTLSGQMLVVI